MLSQWLTDKRNEASSAHCLLEVAGLTSFAFPQGGKRVQSGSSGIGDTISSQTTQHRSPLACRVLDLALRRLTTVYHTRAARVRRSTADSEIA